MYVSYDHDSKCAVKRCVWGISGNLSRVNWIIFGVCEPLEKLKTPSKCVKTRISYGTGTGLNSQVGMIFKISPNVHIWCSQSIRLVVGMILDACSGMRK